MMEHPDSKLMDGTHISQSRDMWATQNFVL